MFYLQEYQNQYRYKNNIYYKILNSNYYLIKKAIITKYSLFIFLDSKEDYNKIKNDLSSKKEIIHYRRVFIFNDTSEDFIKKELNNHFNEINRIKNDEKENLLNKKLREKYLIPKTERISDTGNLRYKLSFFEDIISIFYIPNKIITKEEINIPRELNYNKFEVRLIGVIGSSSYNYSDKAKGEKSTDFYIGIDNNFSNIINLFKLMKKEKDIYLFHPNPIDMSIKKQIPITFNYFTYHYSLRLIKQEKKANQNLSIKKLVFMDKNNITYTHSMTNIEGVDKIINLIKSENYNFKEKEIILGQGVF